MGSFPGLGRSPGEGNGNSLQYSCLENSMDRRAWQDIVHGVTRSWMGLSDRAYMHTYIPPDIHFDKTKWQDSIVSKLLTVYLLRPVFFLFLRFIYLFLAALVLCYCENFSLLAVSGAALSCDTWASHYSRFSCCGAQPLECIGFKLWCMGLVATRHVGSSRSRNWTRVSWIGRRLLNHWTTRETCRPIF